MIRSFTVRISTFALIAALAAALPLHASALGTTTGASTLHRYSTTVTPVYGSRYPVAGHLDLEIFPDGVLRGWYHNAFEKEFIPVAGGCDGNYIWFDIGPTLTDLGFGIGLGIQVRVTATMSSDDSLRGQLYPESAGATAASQSDQLLFAAKPSEKSSEDYQGTY